MPSLKLSNPFRRTDTGSSLKRRAAALKSDLLGLTARPAVPTPLPAPGSPEAIAAWGKARSEFDRIVYRSEAEAEAEYAALRVGDTGILWTTDWVRAAQRGDYTRFATHQMAAAKAVTAAELVDLLVITSRRDLRIAEAQRQTAIRELYALAYPDGEDPEPLPDPDGDYAHVIIAEHRAAYAAWVPHLNTISKAKGGSDEFRVAEEAGEAAQSAEQDAFGELIDAQPSTLGGLIALARYVPEAVRLKRQNLNSIGRLLEAVHVYLDELAERVVVEISARVPTDNIDRDDRLSALVKRQMEVAAAVEDPAIMAEITKAWGG